MKMKKLFTLLISVFLISSCCAAVLAVDFSADGRLRLKYVDENNKAEDKYDALTNIYAKINEEVTLTGVLRAKTGSNDYIYEVYGTYAKPFGKINLGYFLYSTCGDLAILTQVIDDLQTDCGVSWATPAREGWIAKVYYGFGDEDKNDGTYALTFGYSQDTWGADINLVESRLRDVYKDSKDKDYPEISGDYAKPGIALNAFYEPVKPLRLYLNCETRDEYHRGQSFQYKDAILGATYSPLAKLTLIGEYNFEQNGQDCNNWGLRVNYKITPETTLSLIRYQEVIYDYDDQEDRFKDSNCTEFRVQINF
jgi:hypothetical protein